MAPRRKKPVKQGRVKAAAAKGPEPGPTCSFCGLPQSDDLNGELLSTGSGLHVHYFCMLFSSGLHQRGEEEEPLRGFVEADVRAELRRGNRLVSVTTFSVFDGADDEFITAEAVKSRRSADEIRAGESCGEEACRCAHVPECVV
ncbi:hypothetical protein MRX96_025199 [Rhipicephalus microplus]